MPTFDLNFEVFCGRCGAALCNNTTTRVSKARGEPQAVVEPCERCLEAEYEAGRQAGIKEAEG
jgi:RNase P subunit RPR2